MADAKTDKALEREMRRDAAKTARKKSLGTLLFVYWLLLAFAGTGIAVCLGLARNDWIVWSSSVSPSAQSTAHAVGLVLACAAAGICAVMGLDFIARRSQFVLGPFAIALGGTFPLGFAYGPHWIPFAAGLGAIAFGILTLFIIDRRAARG